MSYGRTLAVICALVCLPAQAQADFLTAIVPFTWSTSDVSGTNYDLVLGFQPKLVCIFTTRTSGTISTVGRLAAGMAFGCGTSSTNRRAVDYFSVDANATASIHSRHDATKVAIATGSGGGVDLGTLDIAAIGGWPSNGIRLTVGTQKTAQTSRLYLFGIGGSDVTAVNVGSFQEPAATGNQSTAHGLGSVPTGLIVFSIGLSTAPASGSSSSADGEEFTLGGYDGTTSWVAHTFSSQGNVTMNTKGYAKSSEIIALSNNATPAINALATAVSWDATNFTLNWSSRASTRYIFFAAWTGGRFKVGNGTTRTDTTGFSGPTAGFVPSLVVVASTSRAESASGTLTAQSRFSLGAGTSISNRFAVALLDEDALADSEVSNAQQVDAVYENISATSTVDGLMGVTDMSVDPIQLVMADADPVASFFGTLMWGGNAGKTNLTLLGVGP